MHVKHAIKVTGSVRQLAATLGVSTQAVYKMRRKGKPMAEKHAEAVRAAAKRRA